MDWLLCRFLLMVYFNGFHPACAVLGAWFFHTLVHSPSACKCLSCIIIKCSEQVFSGSCFNLQVGPAACSHRALSCATMTSLLALSTGLSRMFPREYLLSLIELLPKGKRRKIWSSTAGEKLLKDTTSTRSFCSSSFC